MTEQNELKAHLIELSQDYKNEIEEGIRFVLSKMGKTTVNALIISGSLAFAYLLYRGIAKGSTASSSKKSKKINEPQEEQEYHRPGVMDQITDKLIEQTLIFLLTIAKEKLIEFLNRQEDHDNNTAKNKGQSTIGA